MCLLLASLHEEINKTCECNLMKRPMSFLEDMSIQLNISIKNCIAQNTFNLLKIKE